MLCEISRMSVFSTCCLLDTELIDRYNRAKNQINGFLTPVIVNGFLATTFYISIFLFAKDWCLEM